MPGELYCRMPIGNSGYLCGVQHDHIKLREKPLTDVQSKYKAPGALVNHIKTMHANPVGIIAFSTRLQCADLSR